MTDDSTNVLVVRRDDEHGRYEAFLHDERIGLADFGAVDGAVVLPHLEIEPRHEGRGYASALTRAVLDDLRSHGVSRIVPSCPYVRAWVSRHPEYQDLVGE